MPQKTQEQMFREAGKRLADADQLFMDMMKSDHPITKKEFDKMVKKNPRVWERYRGFFEEESKAVNTAKMIARLVAEGHEDLADMLLSGNWKPGSAAPSMFGSFVVKVNDLLTDVLPTMQMWAKGEPKAERLVKDLTSVQKQLKNFIG